MMNKLLSIGIAVAFNLLCFACGNPTSEPTSDSAQETMADVIIDGRQPQQSPNYKEYLLSEKIIADVNGDKQQDTLEFIAEGPKQGTVLITLGGTLEPRMVICEGDDGETVSNFLWVTNWAMTTDSIVPITNVVDGVLEDGEMKVENPVIILWQEDGGSGFFTFKGGKFVWVTTGC